MSQSREAFPPPPPPPLRAPEPPAPTVRPFPAPPDPDAFSGGVPADPSTPWSTNGAPVSKSGRYIVRAAALVPPVLAAIFGFLIYQWLFGGGDVVYRGANGEIDAVSAESLFTPIPGFGYRDLPPEVGQQAQLMLQQVPELGNAQLGFAARGVTSGGQEVGGVVAVSIPPDILEKALDKGGPIAAMEEAAGVETERLELGGKPAYEVQYGPATMILAFYENQMVLFSAMDESTTK